MFKRELNTGQNNFAYALAKLISTISNELFVPLVFMGIFQWFSSPNVACWKIYLVALGICDFSMTFAHLLSLTLEDNRALIVTVVGICVCNILSGFNPTLHQLNKLGFFGKGLATVSYSRWTLESFYLSIVNMYDGIYNTTIGLNTWNYELEELFLAFTMPFIIGIILKILIMAAIFYKTRLNKK